MAQSTRQNQQGNGLNMLWYNIKNYIGKTHLRNNDLYKSNLLAIEKLFRTFNAVIRVLRKLQKL